MNAISVLKAACLNKPFKSFKNLAVGDYVIENFQRVSTTYGERLRIELFDCIMYLPERFSSIMTDSLLTELNESTVIMAYSGKDPNAQNRLLLDFDVIRTDDSGEMVSTPVIQTFQGTETHRLIANNTIIKPSNLSQQQQKQN